MGPRYVEIPLTSGDPYRDVEDWLGVLGDGLPTVPPTIDRVSDALAFVNQSPDEIIGPIPPLGRLATVETVAAAAVMAGCAPQHMPFVLSAAKAMLVPEFNLFSVQVTTNPVAVAVIVSGPLAEAAGFNPRGNVLGPGHKANITVGRAIRLLLLTAGGASSPDVDRATHGHPGKVGTVVVENRDENPWETWGERLGFDRDDTIVSVMGVSGFVNFRETTDEPGQLLMTFGRSMAYPNGNDSIFGGEPLLAMCPEHAVMLARAGFGIDDVQSALWELARLPATAFSESTRSFGLNESWSEMLGTLDDGSLIPVSRDPAGIRLIVSGGAGRHSMYMPGFGVQDRAVSSEVVDGYLSVDPDEFVHQLGR